MSTLIQDFRDHLRSTGLFAEPGGALLAVSGGLDSVALLDLMSRAAPELGLQLAVAHVDHGISEDSADVAESVMALAMRYKVRGYLAALHLGPEASETRARVGRYSALRELQERTAARYLVTAHQRDDQVETVIFRFLRGSGPAGLAGIPKRGPAGLRRPLLPYTRRQLESWVREVEWLKGYDWHRDPANRDIRHDRNWIRHTVLPTIAARMGPEAERNVLGVARQARTDRRAWARLLRELQELEFRQYDGGVEVARGPLQRYDETLSKTLLQALARECGVRLGNAAARRLLGFAVEGTSGHSYDLSGRWRAELEFDRLRLSSGGGEGRSPEPVAWGSGARGETTWGDWLVRWRRERAGRVERRDSVTWVTPGTGLIRGFGPGDRIRPLGGTGSRPVRRELMEARVPRAERTAHPLITRDGQILWIPGICRSSEAVPSPGDEALRIEVTRG